MRSTSCARARPATPRTTRRHPARPRLPAAALSRACVSARPRCARSRAHWARAAPGCVYIATEGPLGWAARRVARRLGIPVATGLHTRFDHYMRDYGVRFPRTDRAALDAPLPQRRRRDARRDARVAGLPRRARASPIRCASRARSMARCSIPRKRDRAPARAHGARATARWSRSTSAASPRKRTSRSRSTPSARCSACARMRASCSSATARCAHRWREANPDFVFCGLQRGEDLARHFASGDVFLFPSRSETFGNVTLEAMASGVPTDRLRLRRRARTPAQRRPRHARARRRRRRLHRRGRAPGRTTTSACAACATPRARRSNTCTPTRSPRNSTPCCSASPTQEDAPMRSVHWPGFAARADAAWCLRTNHWCAHRGVRALLRPRQPAGRRHRLVRADGGDGRVRRSHGPVRRGASRGDRLHRARAVSRC